VPLGLLLRQLHAEAKVRDLRTMVAHCPAHVADQGGAAGAPALGGPHTKVPVVPPRLTFISPRALTSTLSDLMSRCIRASECRNDTAPARRRAQSRPAPGRRGARGREGRARTERAAEEPCDLALAEFQAPRLVRLSPQPPAPPLKPLTPRAQRRPRPTASRGGVHCAVRCGAVRCGAVQGPAGGW